MGAQPVSTYGPAPWQPDPVRQRLADYTLEDILNLPDEAPRVELVDGRMLPLPSPSIDHQEISSLLWLWFRNHAPRDRWRAVQAVGVAVTPNQTFEPDLLLIDSEADRDRHFVLPDQVGLVVEVVSPGTKRRDRIEKPADYSTAGVRNYWRVELNPVHIYAYRISGRNHYELVADSDTLLELTEPFLIALPISEITP